MKRWSNRSSRAAKKNRQYGPTRTDVKTAALFRRRCLKRYPQYGKDQIVKKLIFLSAVLLLAGCTTVADMKGMSSGHIGCTPDEITITDHSSTSSTVNWTAMCNKEMYICNQDQSGFDQTVSCTERNN